MTVSANTTMMVLTQRFGAVLPGFRGALLFPLVAAIGTGLCWTAGAAPPVPTPIGEFSGEFGTQFAKTGSPEASRLVTEDGSQILRVEEKAALFPGMGITLTGIDGMKSIYVAFDLKTANLSRNATMAYYWTSADGRKLTTEAVPVKVSGTTAWTRYEKILSSPIPLQTGGIRVVFLVWSGDGDGYAQYRNPTIRVATPEDSTRIREASVEKAVPQTSAPPTAESFLHRFTNKMRGASYDVERGGFGWFLLWSKQPLKDVGVLDISAPAAVDFELYLMRGDKAEFVPGESGVEDGARSWRFDGLKRYRWNTWANVLLFRAGAGTPDEFHIRLTFANPEGESFFTEPIPIRTLQPLDLPPVETAFENRVYYAHPFRWIDFDDPRAVLANDLLHYLNHRGFSSAGYLTHADMQPFPEEKGEVISQFNRMPYRFNQSRTMARLLEKHDIPMAMATSGIRSETELETQVVADKGVSFYADMLRMTGNDQYRGRELVWINDYEPYAFEGPATQYSFAPESLAAFRAFIEAPADTALTPETILNSYQEQWVQFRCLQHARVIQAQVEALKAFSPQALYALSSESLPGNTENAAEFFRRIGVELRLMDPYVDMHLPMIYSRTASYYRRLEATVRQLTKPVMPTITCGYANSIRDPDRLQRLMVAAAFLGARGVYHWPGFWGMDGNEVQSIQQAMTLIAKLEPFLNTSAWAPDAVSLVCPEAKTEHLYHAARRNADTQMIFIANDGKSEAYYPLVRLPQAEQTAVVRLFPGGECLSANADAIAHSPAQLRRGFRVKVPAASMAMLRLTHDSPGATEAVIAGAEWEQEYQALKAATVARSRGDAANSMSYRLDGTILEIETPAQRLRLDMQDCGGAEWRLGKNSDSMLLLSFLGRETLDFPGMFRPKDIPTELEAVTFRDDAVELTLYYRIDTVPYEGLAVRKTLTVSRDTPAVDVAVKIIPAEAFRQFALRIVHGVNVGGSRFCLDGEPTARVQDLLVGRVYTREHSDFTPFILSKRVTEEGTFNQAWVGLLLPGEEWRVECQFDDRVQAVMHWHDDTVDTMELLYDKAYEHNDPHRAAVWQCSYRLEARKTTPADKQQP